MGVGGGGGRGLKGAKVSEFCFTKNPNPKLKKKLGKGGGIFLTMNQN